MLYIWKHETGIKINFDLWKPLYISTTKAFELTALSLNVTEALEIAEAFEIARALEVAIVLEAAEAFKTARAFKVVCLP